MSQHEMRVFVSEERRKKTISKPIVLSIFSILVFIVVLSLFFRQSGQERVDVKRVAQASIETAKPMETKQPKVVGIDPPLLPESQRAEFALAAEQRRQREYNETHKSEIAARQRELDEKEKKQKLDAEQEAEKKRISDVVEEWFDQRLKDGSIRKSRNGTYWIDPKVWAVMNRDQKENCVRALSLYTESKTGFGKIATVKSYANDAVLAETTWTGGVEIYY